MPARGLPTKLYGVRTPPALAVWEAANPVRRVDAATMAEHIATVAGHAHVGIGVDHNSILGNGPVAMTGVDGCPRLFELRSDGAGTGQYPAGTGAGGSGGGVDAGNVAGRRYGSTLTDARTVCDQLAPPVPTPSGSATT